MGALTQLLTQLAEALEGDEAMLRDSFGVPGLLQTMQSLQVCLRLKAVAGVGAGKVGYSLPGPCAAGDFSQCCEILLRPHNTS